MHAARHRARGAGARQRATRRSAMTLAELLVVMTIGAVMISLTVASFAAAGRRESREGAAETVMGLLRQARISAVDGGRGAVVRFNPADRSIYGISTAVLGAWHFEQVDGALGSQTTPGAKRNDGTLANSMTPVPGKIGLCLDFDGTNDDVDCRSLPVWDQNEGIRLEAWVNPSGQDGTSPTPVLYGVMGKSGATDGYMLGVAYINGEPAETYHVYGGCYTDQGPIHVASETTIPGNMWSHIAFEFDGYEARVFINGVMADLDSYRQPEYLPTLPAGAVSNPVPDPNTTTDETWDPPALIQLARDQALFVGKVYYAFMGPPATDYFFEGMIDEPQILSVAGGQRTYLPDRVVLVAGERAVHFDGQGYLDIAYHSGPVYVAVGDPYQASALDAALAAGDLAGLTLRNQNPFPPLGGLIIIGDEVIEYDDTNLLQCNTLLRGRASTTPSDHAAGDPVYFARVISVTPTGVVERVRP